MESSSESLLRLTVNPAQAQTPTPLNAGCFTGGERPQWSGCGFTQQCPKVQASAWAADSSPPDHVDTDQVQRKCFQISVWSPSLSWFTSSAPSSLCERNHSPTLRNVHTLSSGPFLHLSRAPAIIQMPFPQSFPHLPLLTRVDPGWQAGFALYWTQVIVSSNLRSLINRHSVSYESHFLFCESGDHGSMTTKAQATMALGRGLVVYGTGKLFQLSQTWDLYQENNLHMCKHMHAISVTRRLVYGETHMWF